METIRAVRAFIARLAGALLAPTASRESPRRHPDASVSGMSSGPLDRRWLRATASLVRWGGPVSTEASARRTTRQRDGDEGEAFARRYLELAGLAFVAANVRYRDGELDLVMRDGRSAGRREPVLVFVEVRRRAGGGFGGAAGSVTAAKRRRIVAAAAHFLVGLGLRNLPACRFDVVTLEGDPARGFCIEWIRDAFGDDG